MNEITLPEAARALSNYLDHACEHCYIRNSCKAYINGEVGDCGHKQAVKMGIDCINEKIALLNLARAANNKNVK